MSNCERLCIKCLNLQNNKINYIKVHGSCEKHLLVLNEFEKCFHCASIVPVISSSSISELNTPNDYKNFGNLEHNFTKSTAFDSQISMSSASLRMRCDYCTEESEVSESKCHIICLSCYSLRSTCPICINSIRTKNLCEFCKNSIDVEKKSCGHLLCSTCYSNSCNLCRLLSHSGSIIESECEYCLTPSTLYACDQNLHSLCSSCLSSGCGICKNRSTLRGRCDFCNESFYTTQCINRHNLCEKCSENCLLCSDELITLNSSCKTPSFDHSEHLQNSIKNYEEYEVRGSGSIPFRPYSILEKIDEENSECEIKSQGCKNEESKDKLDKKELEIPDEISKHYTSNLVSKKEKGRKERKKGPNASQACNKCLMM